MSTAELLADRLAHRRPDHSLDRAFYSDADFHQLDLERVWYRQWLFVGHDITIPSAGDFFTVAIGDYNLIVIRGEDGVVRALHNVCRHRGSVLCEADHGTMRRRIVCPYHQWSYALDGALAKARKIENDFDPGEHGLGVAGCEVVQSMIFVSVAAKPPDFSATRAMLEPYLAPFDLATAKVAHSETVVEHGNWKLVMENNRECFHCKTAHPELCATFPEAPLHSGGGDGDDLIAMQRMVEHCESIGLPSRFVSSDDLQYRAMRMPFLGDARSMTADGTPAVAMRFGDLPDENTGDVLMYHYPSTWNHYSADHAITFRIMPMGPTSTRLVTTWLVPGEAVEGVDYDLANLTAVWRATNAQDTALVERTQRGVNSPAYRPGPYSLVEEEGVIQFIDWYTATMLAD